MAKKKLEETVIVSEEPKKKSSKKKEQKEEMEIEKKLSFRKSIDQRRLSKILKK